MIIFFEILDNRQNYRVPCFMKLLVSAPRRDLSQASTTLPESLPSPSSPRSAWTISCPCGTRYASRSSMFWGWLSGTKIMGLSFIPMSLLYLHRIRLILLDILTNFFRKSARIYRFAHESAVSHGLCLLYGPFNCGDNRSSHKNNGNVAHLFVLP